MLKLSSCYSNPVVGNYGSAQRNSVSYTKYRLCSRGDLRPTKGKKKSYARVKAKPTILTTDLQTIVKK